MNVTQKPFDNPKIRRALNYAINKDALIKVAFAGYAVPAEGPVPPAIDFAARYKPWPYDPAKARELLKEAGYPNGFTTTLWSSHNHSTAQKVLQFTQQQLAQVGVKVTVTAMDAGRRAAQVERRGAGHRGAAVLHRLVGLDRGSGLGAVTAVLYRAAPPKQFNTAFYSNPQVDKDLTDALATTDRAEKQKLYQDAQDRIWADAPGSSGDRTSVVGQQQTAERFLCDAGYLVQL